MQSVTNIDAYIAQQPDAMQPLLQQIRTQIHAWVPGLSEAIAYGMPTLRLHKKNFIHFAFFRQHMGIYPGAETCERLQAQYPQYVASKGTLQFRHDQPFPWDVLQQVVAVRYEIAHRAGQSPHGGTS